MFSSVRDCIYSFASGRAGSLLRSEGFSLVAASRGYSRAVVVGISLRGFSIWEPSSLGWGGFSACVEWAQWLLGTSIPPGLEMEPMRPALAGEVSATGLPGKFLFLIQFSSIAQSCPTLSDRMGCSTLGLPGHHQLQKFTQTHDVHSLDVLFFRLNWEGFVT